MASYRLASEVAQEDAHTMVFRVSTLALEQIGVWSAPSQFMWERKDDGTLDLIIRTVDLRCPYHRGGYNGPYAPGPFSPSCDPEAS